MIVVLEHDAGLGLRRVRMQDRLLARIRAAALDAELAAGASPESSVVLALHAVHLCGRSQRRLLAGSLRRIAASADAPTRSRLQAPVCGPAVRRAGIELQAVIDRLVAAGPVSVRGVARVRCLLADGTGPIYQTSVPDRLRNELRAALAVMDPYA
jgi:hypothetical protein